MWNMDKINDLTPESLAAVDLYQPKLEYLLLGSNQTIQPAVVKNIRKALRKDNSELVVEPMDLVRVQHTSAFSDCLCFVSH